MNGLTTGAPYTDEDIMKNTVRAITSGAISLRVSAEHYMWLVSRGNRAEPAPRTEQT